MFDYVRVSAVAREKFVSFFEAARQNSRLVALLAARPGRVIPSLAPRL